MATSTLQTPPFQWQPTLRITRSGTRSFTNFLQTTRASFTSHSSTMKTKIRQTHPLKERSSAASHAISATLFGEDNPKRYYILGGERSVGKTNSAASLAVKFADEGHPTALISFNPIRTLSDIFDQDLTMPDIEGLKAPLFALEVKVEQSKVDKKNYMDVLIEQFGETKIEIRLASARLNEAAKTWNLMLWVDSLKFSNLDMRVVFDTSLMDSEILNFFCNPDMTSTTMFFRDTPMVFMDTEMTQPPEKDMKRVGELIRGSTEYVITTIPTVKAVKESARAYDILKKEKVHVRRLIVNPILSPMKTEDELRALEMIQNDPELSTLDLIEVPSVDFEMRGIPAIKLMGDMVWK